MGVISSIQKNYIFISKQLEFTAHLLKGSLLDNFCLQDQSWFLIVFKILVPTELLSMPEWFVHDSEMESVYFSESLDELICLCSDRVKFLFLWLQFSKFILSTLQHYKLNDNSGTAYIANLTGDGEKDRRYFAKFLTSQKLLELQLSDSNFRRYVLVQFLILFQYLTSPVKSKP